MTDGEADGDDEAELDGDTDALGLTDPDGDTDGLVLLLGEPEAEGDWDRLGDTVGLILAEGDALNDGLPDAEGDCDAEPDGLGEGVCDPDGDGEGDTLGLPASQSKGASTTANATCILSSVSHANSRSSELRITRRRKLSQRRFVKAGTAMSRYSKSTPSPTTRFSIRAQT